MYIISLYIGMACGAVLETKRNSVTIVNSSKELEQAIGLISNIKL